MASLDCCEIGMPGESRTGIFLRLLHEKNQYARVSLEGKTVDVFPDDMVSTKSNIIQAYDRKVLRG